VEEQNFKNHVKVVPAFIFFVLPVLVLNFGWSLYFCWRQHFSFGSIVGVLTAAALFVGMGLARSFALRVQDRVICLEERLRYEKLLSGELCSRAGELSVEQIVSLRFASDAELPALARKVLDEKLSNRKAIKGLVTHWRADHLRA
jgi:hypothetical protein